MPFTKSEQRASLTQDEVFKIEDEYLKGKRSNIIGESTSNNLNTTRFGIALSGGGDRSAAICLGFLKVFNQFGLLKRVDYISSVAGGGFANAFVQGRLFATRGDYKNLFQDEIIQSLRKHGNTITPGQGWMRLFMQLRLICESLIVLLCQAIYMTLIIGITYMSSILIGSYFIDSSIWSFTSFLSHHEILWWVTIVLGGFAVFNFLIRQLRFKFVLRILFNINLYVAAASAILYGLTVLEGHKGIGNIPIDDKISYLINIITLFLLGFFINPNQLDLLMYFNTLFERHYLKFSKNPRFYELCKATFNIEEYSTPYPIFNTSYHFRDSIKDKKIKGSSTFTNFILSPLFCGSKMTGFVYTNGSMDYRRLNLSTVATISGIDKISFVEQMVSFLAINKFIEAAVGWIRRFEGGIWLPNPLRKGRARTPVWWPLYFVKSILENFSSSDRMIRIQEGNLHESLGVYELLCRRCNLIIAVDAGEDKDYSFAGLKKLIVKARYQLGLEIHFKPGSEPENTIRPTESRSFPGQRFVVADIYQWWESIQERDEATGQTISKIINFDKPKKIGIFVYVKSAAKAPTEKIVSDEEADWLKYATNKYKTYNSDFPHEDLKGQSLDEIQWESYFQLGQSMALETIDEDTGDGLDKDVSTESLITWFNKGEKSF